MSALLSTDGRYSSQPTVGSSACAERAAKRAAKSAAKAAKEAFSDGIDSWMRRLRNLESGGADDDEDEDAGVPDDEHGVDSWLRRLRFDGSDGAGGGGGGGLVA